MFEQNSIAMPFHEGANILYFLKDILKAGDIVRIIPTFEELYMHVLIQEPQLKSLRRLFRKTKGTEKDCKRKT